MEKDIKFNKEQILSSSKFKVIEKDILKTLLEDRDYSLLEVEKILEEFNKKEVI